MGEKKIPYLLPLSLILLIAYTFLAARPLEVEPALSPAWVTPLAATGAADGDTALPEGAIPFSTGTHFGYVSKSGELAFCQEQGERLSLAPFAWSSNRARPEETIIHSTAPSFPSRSAKQAGYPWLADHGAWIVAPEQNGISLLDEGGTARWTRYFTSPITSLDAADGVLLVGLLEGAILAIDRENTVLFSFSPGASRIEAIYGAILSPDARYMAIMSGLDRQRILLLERAGQAWKVVWHRYTDSDFRRPVSMRFLDGNTWLLHEDSGGVSLVDTARRSSRFIALDGTVLDATDTDDDRIFYLLCGVDNQSRELIGLRAGHSIFHRSRWQSTTDFIARSGDYLILGGKEALAGISLEHQ